MRRGERGMWKGEERGYRERGLKRGQAESNIISIGSVCLLNSMAFARCFRVLIWQPGVSKWYWRNGLESHRPKQKQTFGS